MEMKSITASGGSRKSIHFDAPAIEEGRASFGPGEARYILENLNYARQRRVSKGHVLTLATQMQGRVWTQGTQIAFARMPDGKLALVDGQHRLNAIIETGSAQEFQIVIIDVQSDAELHATYYRFDVVRRPRSTEMVLNSAGVIETHGIQHRVARGAYEAGVIIASGMRRLQGTQIAPSLRTPDGRLRAIEPYWPQIKAFNACVIDAETLIKSALCTGSVIAVAILTLRDQSNLALKFWRDIAMNDGLRKGQPERALLQALMTTDFGSVNMNAAIRACANGWNAKFKGRSVDFLKPDMDGEIKILGVRLP